MYQRGKSGYKAAQLGTRSTAYESSEGYDDSYDSDRDRRRQAFLQSSHTPKYMYWMVLRCLLLLDLPPSLCQQGSNPSMEAPVFCLELCLLPQSASRLEATRTCLESTPNIVGHLPWTPLQYNQEIKRRMPRRSHPWIHRYSRSRSSRQGTFLPTTRYCYVPHISSTRASILALAEVLPLVICTLVHGGLHRARLTVDASTSSSLLHSSGTSTRTLGIRALENQGLLRRGVPGSLRHLAAEAMGGGIP